MNKQAVLSLSGGLDSSTLLLHLLANGYECTCVSFDYGQKHSVELERAKSLVDYLNHKLRPQGYSTIIHQTIKIEGWSELLNSSLVQGGSEVPEGHYEESNMSQTVVENRNKVFSSIIQSIALAVANKKDTECKIALGIHAGDHLIYKDCRQEFRDADYEAFLEGNFDAERVKYYTPYLHGDKFTILQDGEKCCNQLGINFNEVYKRTNTSYKPIKHVVYHDTEDEYTGELLKNQISHEEWFSDYKSASSVERVEAFIKLGRPDPVSYADEFGPVTWEFVKEYVSSILDEYAKTV
jgi:7-cyano-7-deazaguanine synthase